MDQDPLLRLEEAQLDREQRTRERLGETLDAKAQGSEYIRILCPNYGGTVGGKSKTARPSIGMG